jgi:hypothetical protein
MSAYLTPPDDGDGDGDGVRKSHFGLSKAEASKA